MKTIRFKSALPVAVALLVVVAGGCSEDDDNNFSEKDGKLLVTKMEFKASYWDEEVGNLLPIGEYDLTEMKYNEQGELAEWWSNGVCAGHYTYTEEKILVREEPISGSFEHILSPEGKVVETVYADVSRDKLVYNEKGQCVEINHNSGYTTLFQWADGQVTSVKYKDMAGMPSCRIDYTDIPQKSNAPCLRSLLLNYCGYFTNLEISGHLDISSDKYLPAKAVMEYEDGYVMIFEATYDLNPDGTVKTVHVTLNDGMLSSLEENRLVYDANVTYTYITK